MGNVEAAWEDVISVIQMMGTNLIVIRIAPVCMIVVLAVIRKWRKPLRGFIRRQSVTTFVLIATVSVNLAVTGTLCSTLNVILPDKGQLAPEHVTKLECIAEEVINEGVILTKNSDSPLPIAPQKTNVSGWASTNPICGGTGFSTVDASTATGILEGIEQAGFEINGEPSQTYVDYREDWSTISINNGQDWTFPEIPVENYPADVMSRAKELSDTAVIIISRTGGEGANLPHDMGPVMDGSTMEIDTKYMKGSYTNNSEAYVDFKAGQSYLELSRTEKNLVDIVCSEFENVVAIYNGTNTLGFGQTEEYEQIKSVLLCAGVGTLGFRTLGNILAGEVSPSGKTTDTWLRDLTKTPYINNIGHFAHINTGDVEVVAKAARERADDIVSFVNYAEGIYVGYRFYEITAEKGLIDYNETVMYPFGYGLGYTGFEQKMGGLQVDGDTIRVDIIVASTGNKAGKDVAGLYYILPHTSSDIEKSSANLAVLNRTDLLEPGQSQTLTLIFDVEDMVSYDTYGTGHYVVEVGDYEINLRTDSHTVVDIRNYQVAETIVYDEGQIHNDDMEMVANRLESAEGDVVYLLRRDGSSNYNQAAATPADYRLNGMVQGNGAYDPTEYNRADDVMPVTGVKNGLELLDLRDADYDDPRWEVLLDRVTVDEMVDLIVLGGHQNAVANSARKIRILDTDGPAEVNFSTLGAFGAGFCSEVVSAQTWDVDLAVDYARAMGQESKDSHITGWYALSMNVHRSASGGHDSEYYLEDNVLSAKIAVVEVEGTLQSGIYPLIKHFALNEQEINRNALLCTWSTEQAIREIYPKPSGEVIKSNPDGKLTVTSSYNYIGTQWAGGCAALLQDVLRGEWGFRGMVLSGYFGDYGYMDADRAVRGGTDIMLGTVGNDAIMTDLSAISVLVMRQAVKNVFYTTISSSAHETYVPDEIPVWPKLVYMVDGVIAMILVLGEVVLIVCYRKKRRAAGAAVVTMEVEGAPGDTGAREQGESLRQETDEGLCSRKY